MVVTMKPIPANGYVLALDPATKTGYAIGRAKENPLLATVDFGDEFSNHNDIFRRAHYWLAGVLKAQEPDLFVIEDVVPPSMKAGKTTHNVSSISLGLSGIFIGMAGAHGIPVLRAPISTWRKCFLGRGNLPRDAAKLAAKRQCRALGWAHEDDNAAEAGGIWFWACGQITPQSQRGIVAEFDSGSPL
jgi:hypothetical protein